MGGRRAKKIVPVHTSDLVKMVGTANWCALSDADHGQVTRAILRDGRTLVVDMRWEGNVYSATLTRDADGSFHGAWTCRGTSDTGTVIARIYKSPVGDVVLGEWSEVGVKHHWWAELNVVEHFDDEK